MASKDVIQMPADELYARWQGHIKRIYTETVYLITTRYQFREVQGMFPGQSGAQQDRRGCVRMAHRHVGPRRHHGRAS
jgi:hypothetical protein